MLYLKNFDFARVLIARKRMIKREVRQVEKGDVSQPETAVKRTCVLKNRHAVEVRVDHLVCDVAVHKHAPRRLPDDLVRGHARIAAPNPEDLGCVTLLDLVEVLRVLFHHTTCPSKYAV
jgi:hypothetical protein